MTATPFQACKRDTSYHVGGGGQTVSQVASCNELSKSVWEYAADRWVKKSDENFVSELQNHPWEDNLNLHWFLSQSIFKWLLPTSPWVLPWNLWKCCVSILVRGEDIDRIDESEALLPVLLSCCFGYQCVKIIVCCLGLLFFSSCAPPPINAQFELLPSSN